MPIDKKTLIVVGLGNPDDEHSHTRHNAGRDAAALIAKKFEFPAFLEDKKMQALRSEGKIGKRNVLVLLPQTFMNKSGETFKKLGALSQKQIAENVVVLHDDLDLPLGRIKLVKNRGSAGHKGVESVMRALKTENFTRVRIGIAKASQIKKSQDDKTVIKIVIGKISPEDAQELKKVLKKAVTAIELLAEEGLEKAMNASN